MGVPRNLRLGDSQLFVSYLYHKTHKWLINKLQLAKITITNSSNMEKGTPFELIRVKTTLPAICKPVPIETERLIIRPFVADDLERVHMMRSQPEVMQWSKKGLVDKDLATTKILVDSKLRGAGQNHQTFAICLKSTGKLIGTGGAHSRCGHLGWPELGYMFMKEAWGQGYASEFLKAVVAYWWSLPREEVEIEVEKASITKDDGGGVIECLSACTDLPNLASQKVMGKCGFELVKMWNTEDFKKPGKFVDVPCYVVRRPQNCLNVASQG